jgi:hypothetical protein
MKIVKDTVTFSTSTERYAHRGIIGLSPEMTVTEGYDGRFWSREEAEYRDDPLTPAERVELADYMIEQWKTFRDMALAEGATVRDALALAAKRQPPSKSVDRG